MRTGWPWPLSTAWRTERPGKKLLSTSQPLIRHHPPAAREGVVAGFHRKIHADVLRQIELPQSSELRNRGFRLRNVRAGTLVMHRNPTQERRIRERNGRGQRYVNRAYQRPQVINTATLCGFPQQDELSVLSGERCGFRRSLRSGDLARLRLPTWTMRTLWRVDRRGCVTGSVDSCDEELRRSHAVAFRPVQLFAIAVATAAVPAVLGAGTTARAVLARISLGTPFGRRPDRRSGDDSRERKDNRQQQQPGQAPSRCAIANTDSF